MESAASAIAMSFRRGASLEHPYGMKARKTGPANTTGSSMRWFAYETLVFL